MNKTIINGRVGLLNSQIINNSNSFKTKARRGIKGITLLIIAVLSIMGCSKDGNSEENYSRVFKTYGINPTRQNSENQNVENSIKIDNSLQLDNFLSEITKPKSVEVFQSVNNFKCSNCPNRYMSVSFGVGNTYRIDYSVNSSGQLSSVTNMYSVGLVIGQGFTMTSYQVTSSGAIIEGYQPFSILGGVVSWQFNSYYRFTLTHAGVFNNQVRYNISRLAVMY